MPRNFQAVSGKLRVLQKHDDTVHQRESNSQVKTLPTVVTTVPEWKAPLEQKLQRELYLPGRKGSANRSEGRIVNPRVGD